MIATVVKKISKFQGKWITEVHRMIQTDELTSIEITYCQI